MRNMISVRLESDVARHAAKARDAAATAASTSSVGREIDPFRLPAGGRVVDRAAPTGRTFDDAPADPVRHPAQLGAGVGGLNRAFCDLGHLRWLLGQSCARVHDTAST